MKIFTIAALTVLEATAALAGEHTRNLVISIPERKIVLLEDGQVKKSYDVAVGKDSTPSPTGEFQIANRVQHPTWYGPKQVVPPGKDNPLGTRWMGLGFRGYGIHGTNAPGSIGKAASHGCIRMRNSDVEELFTLVEAGDAVEIIDSVAAAGGGN